MHNSGNSKVNGSWSCHLHHGDPYHGEAPPVQAGKPLQPLPTVCLVFPALLSAPSPSHQATGGWGMGASAGLGGDKGQERALNGVSGTCGSL